MVVRRDHRIANAAFVGLEPHGRVMFFGRPTLAWEDAPSPEDYYGSLGFSEVHSLDVSDYQGATFLHDLNAPSIPKKLRGRYDFVLSGGTLEHIFNILNAFKAGVDLLKVGGTFLCGTPVNNWIDHGFWQVSPTMKFDFFADNRFAFGTSAANLQVIEQAFRRVVPLYPGETAALNFIPARVGHQLAVIKTEEATFDVVPMQSLYLARLSEQRRRWRFKPFAPFDVDGDTVIPAPSHRFALQRDDIKRHARGFYFIRFTDERFPPSAALRPFRSRALVYEDGELLDGIVSHEEMLLEARGSFCHFGGRINFTSRDGTDPRGNGKRYEVAFWQPFDGVKPYVKDRDYAGPR